VGLAGSQGYVKTAAAALSVFDIKINGVSKGSMRFAATATVATFTWTTLVTVVSGDRIEIFAPTPVDTALSDPTWTLRGLL
jgi:hypothetical protein